MEAHSSATSTAIPANSASSTDGLLSPWRRHFDEVIGTGPLPPRVLAFADAHRRALFAVILLLYLIGFNGQWRVERDSALYLTIARNLAEGGGYTYHGDPHHLAFPGLPLVFAGLFKVFHTESVLPALVLMLLMGLATLGLTYRLFLLHAGRPTAVLMTFGLAVTRLFYRYCFELLSDLPFLMGVMAFFVGYEAIFHRRKPEPGKAHARWFDWFLLVAGLAIAVATRPAMWALLAAILLAVAWSVAGGMRRRKLNIAHVILGLGILCAALVFMHVDLRRGSSAALPTYEDELLRGKLQHVSTMLRLMWRQNIPELCEAVMSKALFGSSIGPGLNTLVAAGVVCLSFVLLRFRPLWGLWSLLTIGMLLLFKPLDRYFLPIVPLLVFAWWQFLVWVNGALPGRRGNLVFAGLFALGGVTNIVQLSKIVFEQRRVPFIEHFHEGRYASMYEVGDMVREHTTAVDWILVEPKVARVMTWVSHRNAIEPTELSVFDPAAGTIFALVGPNWDETRPKESAAGPPHETVELWIFRRGYSLGPPVEKELPDRSAKEMWRLCRVLPGKK